MRRKLVTLVTVTLGVLVILTYVVLTFNLRWYGTPGQTQNGGITYGQCGVEIWGEPGHFCGDY